VGASGVKILIDPVYTGKAHKCSTSYLVWEIMEGLSKWRDDVFFYLMYPEASEANEEEMAFLKRMPDRVKLLPYPYIQADRVEEMFKLHEKLIHYLAPGDSPVWDYDIVISSRTPQLPFMRNVAGREVANYPKGSQRLFLALEEMPIFSFRDTVSWAGGGHMDLQSLAAYQSAGAVVINNLWTKAEVLKVGRQWLSPSKIMDLTKTMHEAVPVKLTRLEVKTPKKAGDTLNVVFAGRMTGTRNFKEVAELFRKHFSYPLGKGDRKVRFIVTTNSMSTGSTNVGEIDFMEIQHNNREQFHKLLREEAHVVVNLSTVEDFSLSTYEPLLFGVPVIVPSEPWADFLGKDYPFRVGNFTEAYAAVKAFATGYNTRITEFQKWERTTWKDMVEGPRNQPTVNTIKRLVAEHEAMLHQRLEKSEGGASYKEMCKGIAALPLADSGLIDPLEYAHSQGYFLTNAKQWKGIPVGKRPCAHLLKVYLNMAGYRDTNSPGMMLPPIAA
jgi:hypothetical protein